MNANVASPFKRARFVLTSFVFAMTLCFVASLSFEVKHVNDQRAIEPELTLRKLENYLLVADRSGLREICSENCWKSINRQYDFFLARFRHKGTFDEFLTCAGNAMKQGRQRQVDRTALSSGATVLYFDASPEGVTIVVQKIKGKFQVVYISTGEIDPEAIELKLADALNPLSE